MKTLASHGLDTEFKLLKPSFKIFHNWVPFFFSFFFIATLILKHMPDALVWPDMHQIYML